MEHFSAEGDWWLPETPGRRVAGSLTFDASGLELIVHAALSAPETHDGEEPASAAGEWTVIPVIFGRLRDGREATMLRAAGVTLRGPVDEAQESYRVDFALLGCHAHTDAFVEARCRFDYLDAWTDPPSIKVDDHAPSDFRVQLETAELASANIDQDVVRLLTGVSGSAGDSAIHLDQWSAFSIELVSEKGVREIVDTRVRPLQDLLVFTLGRPVRMTSVLLRRAGADKREGLAAGYFDAVQPTSGETPSLGKVLSYAAPTILTGSDDREYLPELLVRWFGLWNDLRRVVALLLAPFYAPFMYSEHRFASTFQSAEALHDARYSGKELTKSQHRKRVKDVLDAARAAALDEAAVDWAGRVLRSRNDKPLWKRMDDILRSTGTVGTAVLDVAPDFSKALTSGRTEVSHGGASGDLPSVGRHHLGEILRWVMRARLLLELGMPLAAVEERILGRTAFRHAVDQLRPSTRRATSP